jgi:GMP synthase (glutamine-hydrolysing)
VSQPHDQRVLVVDFGAQYGQLIARRVRDLQVFSEVVPCDIDIEVLKADPPAALILSGGPASVYAEDAPELDARLLELGVPILGFCYGMQAMAQALGGSVAHTDVAEYGPAKLTVAQNAQDVSTSILLKDTPETQTVWMSHRDAVSAVPSGFVVTASTPTTAIAAMECAERGLYATQFHPEVHHTVHGTTMLRHFLFDVAGLTPSWTMDNIAETAVQTVRAEVGEGRVILGLSGGVDSSVVAALLARAIGRQLTCVFVDHGLLRQGEPEQVVKLFTTQFDLDLVYVDVAERFQAALAGVTDPEQKRGIIGSTFWQVFFEEAEKIAAQTGEPVRFLAQGTIYPDIIESGARRSSGGVAAVGATVFVTASDGETAEGPVVASDDETTEGLVVAEQTAVASVNADSKKTDAHPLPADTGSEKAATIKSHHNLVPFPEGVHFELIEPLRNLFKDEVRALGTALGLPDSLVYRQPFPGPGLAVRIIGEVTQEKLAALKEADAIVREELDAYNAELFERTGVRDSERAVWQYFAVLPDIRSVGVMGDERTYERPIIVRAVESRDAMTADWARLPHDVLARISTRIVAEVEGINRVAYDITSKPPGTIEWE